MKEAEKKIVVTKMLWPYKKWEIEIDTANMTQNRSKNSSVPSDTGP